MRPWFDFPGLWAGDFDSFFRGLGSEFRGKNAHLDWRDGVTALCILGVCAMLVFALSIYIQKRDGQGVENNPKRLFRELCKAHGIDWRGRHALLRLAQFLKLDHAARMFLEPERLDAGLEARSLAKYHEQYRQLQQRLFAWPAPADAANSSGAATVKPAT